MSIEGYTTVGPLQEQVHQGGKDLDFGESFSEGRVVGERTVGGLQLAMEEPQVRLLQVPDGLQGR